MIIKGCRGYELEKEKPNTSEDYFNRSEVTYEVDGKTSTLHVLYVRTFEDKLNEFTPYEQNPIFLQGEKHVDLKDIVALACITQNPAYLNRKRVYINNEQTFRDIFRDLDWSNMNEISTSLSN